MPMAPTLRAVCGLQVQACARFVGCAGAVPRAHS